MKDEILQSDATKKGWLTIALCFLAALCEGIDLQAAGVAAAGIRQQFHPDSEMLSYFFTASTLGLFFGAIIGGRLADHFGRKRVLVGSVILFGVFSLATSLAWDVSALTWARLLTGLGLGGALPNLVSIGSESAPAHRRSANVALIYAGTPLGGAVASFVSLVTLVAHWRWIFIVGGIIPMLVAPAIAIWLKESETFARVKAGANSRSIGPGNLFSFLGEGRLLRTLLLWASFFLALLTLYLLLNWLPILLGSGGLDKIQVAVSMIGFNVGGALSALYVGFHLETRVRHRGVLIIFIGMPMLIVLLANGPSQASHVALIAFALGAAVISAQVVLYSFAPLCYPTRVRGTGVGFAIAMGRIGSVVGPLLGGSLVGSGRSPSQVLMGVLPIVLAGSVCAIILAWRQPPPQTQ